MTKRVLDVGNCLFDHSAIRRAICANFDADVVLVNDPDEALRQLHQSGFDLVLINRRLHGGLGDGIELIRRIKSHPKVADRPVMLLSDYQEYQRLAVEAGAQPGFGKSGLDSAETRRKLAQFLE
jgi:CheY-like chemotaxis protein